MADNYFIYFPKTYRQHNQGPSCVFASVSNSLRNVGLFDAADEFWDMYKMSQMGGESPQGVVAKLNRMHIKVCITGQEQDLINALKVGRAPALSWGGAHCVNLIGKIDNTAYILDNNRPGHYVPEPWQSFIRDWHRCGGWAVVILSGRVHKPIQQDSLGKYQDR